ncbi:MAG: ribose-phosphate pyrophosphokinase [Pseudomonadota bacterium]
MLVVALPGGAATAAALASELQCPVTELVVHRFPDGETLVRIDAPVQGECVVLAGSLHQPDSKTLPLLFAADAARELGAARIGLVAPYLSYMRQDARFHPGEAVTSRSYARLLSTAVDFLVTVDPHLHRWNSLTDIYAIPSTVVPSASAIALWLRNQVSEPLLVGPDSESAQWVAEVARLAHAPWTAMVKTRRGDRDVSVVLQPDPAWRGRTAVLLDDIVSTGHTMAAAAEALRDAGFTAPTCIAVHALFEDGAMERLKAAGAGRIASCDTVSHATNAIPLGPLLAQATQALAER